MRLFWKRYTTEQKAVLRDLAESLNVMSEDLHKLTLTMVADNWEFIENCENGRRGELGRPLSSVTDDEIEAMRIALASYSKAVESYKQELKNVNLPDWAPAKFVKYRQDQKEFSETISRFIDMSLEGLESPHPLVDQLGVAKLNMFCAGIGLSIKMAQHHRIKP